MTAFVDHDPREPSEHSLQVKLLDIIEIGKVHPDVTAVAIPNAGRRSWKTGKKMKAEGMRKGAPDLAILMPEARVFWLEMKKRKGGRISDEQLGFGARCKRLGHSYAVANNLADAVTILIGWGVLKPTVSIGVSHASCPGYDLARRGA